MSPFVDQDTADIKGSSPAPLSITVPPSYDYDSAVDDSTPPPSYPSTPTSPSQWVFAVPIAHLPDFIARKGAKGYAFVRDFRRASHRALSRSSSFSSTSSASSGWSLSTSTTSRRPSHIKRFLALLSLAVLSFAGIFFLITTIPGLSLPYTLQDVRHQAHILDIYKRSSTTAYIHVFSVLSALFVWKQTFSVPGSVFMNILFGALFGTFAGTIFTSILTAIGGTCAYLLASVCTPLVERYMAASLAKYSSTVRGNSHNLFSYMTLLRLFPLLPWSVLNIASGVLSIPLFTFFSSLLIGSIPYNYITVQIGDIMATAAYSHKDLSDLYHDPVFITKAVLVIIISILPAIFGKRIGEAARRRASRRANKLAAVIAAGQLELELGEISLA